MDSPPVVTGITGGEAAGEEIMTEGDGVVDNVVAVPLTTDDC